MVLPKGPFWEHVEETTDGIRMCKFCRHSFSKQTPITRFKFHWSGVQSRGTKICDSVPKPVRKAALAAVSQKTELRTTSSSSNNCADNAISTALQEQNDQVENAVTDEATSLPSQLYSQGRLNYCLEAFRELDNGEAAVSCAPGTTPGTEQVGRESQRNTCDILPLSMDYVMEDTNVQEAAFLDVHGGNKRQKTIASSSNVNDNAISSCPQEENNEVHNLAGDAGGVQMTIQGTEQGVGEGRTSSRAEAGNLMENMAGGRMHIGTSITSEDLIVDAHETRREASQAPDVVEKYQEVGVEFSSPTHVLLCNMFRGAMETDEEDRVPGRSMDDAPQSGQRTQQVGQLLEQSTWMVYGVDNWAGDGGRIQMEVQGMEQGDVHETRGEASQPLSPGAPACIDSITELILDAPETRPRTEQARQESEVGTCDLLSSFMEDRFTTNDVENPPTGWLEHFERGSSPEWLSRDSSQSTDLLCLGLGRDCGQLCSSSLNNDVILNDVENMIREIGQPVVRGISHQRLTVNQDEPRGDSSQPTDLLCFTLGRCYDQPYTPSVNNDVIMNGIKNIIRESRQHLMRDASHEFLQQNGHESRGDAFPAKKLVGGEFEKNKNAILSWLTNDEASSSMGIYGMGGVGKTSLLTHIHNLLPKPPYSFRHVSWITVSQDFSISKLQNLIAEEFHVDLSRENNEKKRAAKLFKKLSKMQPWVLILDDLWNYFDFDEVGIPVQAKRCKFILTTRLEKVCQQMDCQKKIKVEPLSRGEAWTLFMEKLGCGTTLPPEVEQIAKSVARECGGLPLGIITIAAAMRGVVDIREWRNVLGELEESKVRQDDMEPEVFRVLRFSYTHLKDSLLQQCFLYCSLFPEDFEVDRNDLIGYLIDEGVIKGMKSRQAEFDKGHAMLNKLLNVCLLERGRYSTDESVKMHDLIRDMALQIQQENSQVMVKAGAQLIELPDAEEWTENLLRVSLMENQIEEILPIHSPSCNNLSTLLLSGNNLSFIADSFFEQLKGLKLLDLSDTRIKILPDSISDLVSLISLLLSQCQNLRHVPSLKNLKRLKRLDLSYTALEKVPQGMECLSNLRYLRLNGCGEKEFPIGILPQLSHLQVFLQECWLKEGKYAPVTVKEEEVACLRKLETLECRFEGHSDFVEYFKYPDQTQSLSRYTILIGVLDESDYESWRDCREEDDHISRIVWLGNFSIRRDLDFSFFPSGIQQLIICKCNDARSLCDVSSLEYATELEAFTIMHCNSMESLVSSSWFCSAPPPAPSNGIFYSLKEFECYNCRSMKKLFPLVLLPNLVNLEEIRVEECEKMEEIIAGRDEEGVMGEEFSLPKLKILSLSDLPELKSICSAKLRCDSLEKIEVWDCQKLNRMPICLPLLDNGQPSPPSSLSTIYIIPEERWESLEWEHPNAKYVLRPFVRFWDPTKREDLRPVTMDAMSSGVGAS